VTEYYCSVLLMTTRRNINVTVLNIINAYIERNMKLWWMNVFRNEYYYNYEDRRWCVIFWREKAMKNDYSDEDMMIVYSWANYWHY